MESTCPKRSRLCYRSCTVWPGCDTTNFFFGVGKASFLNTAVSPTFASKMVSVTEQIKDAEGKLSVDAFREVYDLSKFLVIVNNTVNRPDSIHWPV